VATAALLGVIVACVEKVVVGFDDVGSEEVPDEDGNLVLAKVDVPAPDVPDEAPDKEVPVTVVLRAEVEAEEPLALVPLGVGPDDTPDGGVVEPLAEPLGYVREEGTAMPDVADGSGDENDPLIPSSAKLGV